MADEDSVQRIERMRAERPPVSTTSPQGGERTALGHKSSAAGSTTSMRNERDAPTGRTQAARFSECAGASVLGDVVRVDPRGRVPQPVPFHLEQHQPVNRIVDAPSGLSAFLSV